MTALRLSWDEAGAMILPRVWRIFKYWQEFPPEHFLLRGFTGYEPPDTDFTPSQDEELFVQSLGMAKPFDCLPPAIQQWLRSPKVTDGQPN